MRHALERTVAFVDLAGFTALTEAHGDAEAADLAERFVNLAQAALTPADRLVKAIGDAVMLASADPVSGLRLVERVVTDCYAAPGFPIPRTGLHHGPVVERNGDLFGATVNLAARTAGYAAGGQTVGTAPIADAARSLGTEIVDLGVVDLRNLARPVELFELRLGPRPAGGSVDPVCRMLVPYSKAAGRLRYAGVDFYFCSLECAAAFASEPEHYAAR